MGLAPSTSSECLCVLTYCYPPLSPSAVTHGVLGGSSVSRSLSISSPHQVAVLSLVSRVAEDFPPPSCTCPSFPGTQLPSRVTSEALSPWGNSSTLRVLVPLGNWTPPPTPWQPPRVFLPIRRPCTPPILLPLRRTCWPGFPSGRRPSPFLFFRPMVDPCSCCFRVLGRCVQAGASTGRCIPWTISRSASL